MKAERSQCPTTASTASATISIAREGIYRMSRDIDTAWERGGMEGRSYLRTRCAVDVAKGSPNPFSQCSKNGAKPDWAPYFWPVGLWCRTFKLTRPLSNMLVSKAALMPSHWVSPGFGMIGTGSGEWRVVDCAGGHVAGGVVRIACR
jgi:hypothetical protein